MAAACRSLFKVLLFQHCIACHRFVMSSSLVFEHSNEDVLAGKILAFGNVDSDKSTDILCVNGSLQWSLNGQTFTSVSHAPLDSYDNVQLLDLDDNVVLDAMATVKNGGPLYKIHLFYNMDFEKVSKVITSFTRPLLFDSNGDHIIDVLTKNQNGNWEVWNWNSTIRTVTASSISLATESSNSAHYLYGDMNGDCWGDFVAIDTDSHEMEVHLWKENEFTSQKTSLTLELGEGTIFSEVLIDLDVNGLLDLIVVVRQTDKYQVVMSLQPNDRISPILCESVPERPDFSHSVNVASCNLTTSPFLSTGDVNLDGFPDLLVTCNGRVLLFLNSGCGQGCRAPPNLQTADVPVLSDLRNVTRAVFFDLGDDGTLDVLVEFSSGLLRFLEFVPGDASMFLKVYAPPSASSRSSLHGSTVGYSTHDRDGRGQASTGHFWSSSATSFLPLPYVVLGLGLAPNFVEDFLFGVSSRGAGPGSRKWTRLIPNSQLRVISNPVSEPDKWRLSLYLTPSKLVWITAGVMTAVCILVSILVLVLHLRERFIDAKERKQRDLQFHFDAM